GQGRFERVGLIYREIRQSDPPQSELRQHPGNIALTDELKNDFAEIPIEDLYESENPLVPGRTCGSCMLCCTVMLVDELNKPAGTTCSYAVAGSGCTTREHRPRSCRRFFCGWRLDPNIDSLWKPSI